MSSEIELILGLLLSLALGGIIGIEREKTLKPAGLRTHMLVSLGSALIAILSLNAFTGSDPSRLASMAIVGIGFIGAGTILKTEEKVVGLTTAASLWITAAVGLAVGSGLYLVAIISTILATATLQLKKLEEKI